MWGSDWPVVNLNGDYASWFEQVLAALGGARRSSRLDPGADGGELL
jgi:predicted TIM-barrel fold metal-dependent hydrolase